MDAYDIFKKLTKGLTFKQSSFGRKNNDTLSKSLPTKKEELEVNGEQENDNEEFHSDDEEPENSDSDAQSDEQPDLRSGDEGDESDIQILDGVKIGKKKKKKEKKEKSDDLKKKLELEEHNRFRNEHGIKTVGRHVAAALKDFQDLVPRYNVSQALVDTVIRCGYSEPTPVQRQAVPCMLEDRQILACAPTGSGKTAAFLLPILHMLGAPAGGPRALILCPTRELVLQIYRETLRLSESTELRCSIVRSLKESKVKEREATIRKSDIVISTPNRLCYLLNQDKVNISLDKVRWLIIDEADKMFEGTAEQESAFRQQLEQILGACSGRHRRVAMFSATHTPAVAKWARHSLRGIINVTVGQRNAATSLVDQELLFCGSEAGKLLAFRQLVQKGLKPPVLVFVQSKDRAKQLFKELIYDGINVDVIHADRTQTQRDNVVRSFRVGKIWVLICTELLARGIDFRGVNLVLNYDFPPTAIAYIHRIGRAGRAGQRGKAITFFTEDDVANLRSIASVMQQSGCAVPPYALSLRRHDAKRRVRARKAPNREDISTVLARNKRKLEEGKENSTEKAKDAKAVNNAKSKKQRRVQNGDSKQEKGAKGNKRNNFAKDKSNKKTKVKTLKKGKKNVLKRKNKKL